MEILYIILTSLGSVIALFLLTKLMGNRQMSQLSMFDYINGITIGSIAAEMATSLEDDFLKPLTAMVVYALISIIISKITSKSIILRRFITGETIILFNNDKIYEKNLNRAKIDINEFLTECRNNGFFNLENIQTAIMESNGKISFLPKSSQRPVTPHDLDLSPLQERAVVNVIIDGKILINNLKFTRNNKEWLNKQLEKQGIDKVSDVCLATCDINNNLNVYIKIKTKSSHDMFE